MLQSLRGLWILLACAATTPAHSQPRFPNVLNDDWKLQLVACEPELVTPVSCRFDAAGRLLVVESHTHFPAPDYSGPKCDRIFLFDQFRTGLDPSRVEARKRLYHEGGRATMGLAVADDGWTVVSTRSEVARIRDSDGDGLADQREVLLRMETSADYPHNGLGCVAIGPDGWLYLGQGENFGEKYRLVGTDGSFQKGGGEGGNVFRCTPDGRNVERVATGFWNPFGLGFDPAGRLWAVENDPDSRPPCRMLQVVPGGDYGFQFRFGRAGIHPLIAWNGELPGTLPMATGTGEAPCAVIAHDGCLWVTSWGSNRLERHVFDTSGGQTQLKMEIVIQGDADFRPVDMAVAPDGSLFFTDWVDRSYPVHGRGRLWRLIRRVPRQAPTEWPRLTAQEQQASRLARDPALPRTERIAGLDSDDPVLHQAAAVGLARNGALSAAEWEQADTPRRQLGLLMAARWQALSAVDTADAPQPNAWIEKGIAAADGDVRIAAIRWAAESHQKSSLPAIRDLLEQPQISPQLFACAVSAIAFLETGNAAQGVRDPACEKLLQGIASDSQRPLWVRAAAVRLLPAAADLPAADQLYEWASLHGDRTLGSEIVRLLADRGDPAAHGRLLAIATDPGFDHQVRADAIAGLAGNQADLGDAIRLLAGSGHPEIVRSEASRVLEKGPWNRGQTLPPAGDIDAWNRWIGSAGDPDAGRRVFFRTSCADCHSHSGRGSRRGPDLTSIGGQMDRRRILESILLPSREVGPLYIPWKFLTTDGKTLVGMRLEESGASDQMHVLGADGIAFVVPLAEIEQVEPSALSIMPSGLEATLSQAEFADLLAFLSAE